MTDLGLPSGYERGEANDVNEAGEVAVTFSNHGPQIPSERGTEMQGTPFLWSREQGLRRLPKPAGYTNVWPVAINSRGMVLLRAKDDRFSSPWKSFLLAGVLKEPPSPLPESALYVALNDHGWLVGITVPKGESNRRRGFVAIPTR
jgi:hypothetical protein